MIAIGIFPEIGAYFPTPFGIFYIFFPFGGASLDNLRLLCYTTSKDTPRKEPVMPITLSPLTPAALTAYAELYEASVPPAERKPLDSMMTGDNASAYELLVISTPVCRVAGLCITVRHGDLVMLDYFAVTPDLRGHGIGRAALPLIRERYTGSRFFLEIEAPPPVDPRDRCPNTAQRIARKNFYASAGMVSTGIRAYIYDSDMELWGFPEDAARLTFEDYAALLAATFPATMRPERL